MLHLSFTKITWVPGALFWDGTTPPGKVWQSALRYTQSCPGCEVVYWGQNAGIADVVYLITLWSDEEAHKEYQESMGVSVTAGFLDGPVEGWCRDITTDLCTFTDSITIIGKRGLENTEGRKTESAKEWMAIERLLRNWNLPFTKIDLNPSNVGEDVNQSWQYVGLIVIGAGKDVDDGEIWLKLREVTTTEVLKLHQVSKIVSPGTLTADHLLPSISPASISPTSLASLIRILPQANFTPYPLRGTSGQSFREDRDWKHRVEIKGTWPYDWKYKHTGFPTPRGGYITMDDLKGPPINWKRSRKAWKFWEDEALLLRGSYLVEIQLKQGTTEKLMANNGWWAPVLPGTPEDSEEEDEGEEQEVSNFNDSEDSDASSFESRGEPKVDPVGPIPSAESFAWRAMRRKLLSIQNIGLLVYGPDKSKENTIKLLIARDSPVVEGSGTVTPDQSLFSDLEPYVEEISNIGYFPALEILEDHNQTRFPNGQYLELVKFYIPKDSRVKEAFEHYFYFFARSMEVNNPAVSDHHVHAAGVITKASWQQEDEFNIGSSRTVFVALINWDHKGATVWYRDFHEGMLKSYERLGHTIDGLRAATLNVASASIICRTHRARDDTDVGSFLF